MTDVTAESTAARSRFVQYIAFKVDPLWRRLPQDIREHGRREFAEAIAAMEPDVTTAAYSTLGLKTNADLMLWWKSATVEPVQEGLAVLLQTGLGQYCEATHTLFGLTRPSVYTKTRTNQEQAVNEPDRLKYIIVYPFTKTIEWYLMSQEARQGLMNEHMRVGRAYLDVRQVLLYTTGLDDQEFIVAYETDSLERHQQLVIDLRSTEARRYTLRDTPIITGVYRTLEAALRLLG